MTNRRLTRWCVTTMAVAICHLTGAAIVWPAVGSWTPLTDSGTYMTDSNTDQTTNQIDLVGSTTYAVAYWGLVPDSVNPSTLYLEVRLRVDSATSPNATGRAWGVLIDSNNSPTSAEYALELNRATGSGNVVELASTTTTGPNFNNVVIGTGANILWSGAYTSYSEFVAASDGSAFSGNGDYFIDFAIPWDTFATYVGSEPVISLSPFTSTSRTGVNADVANATVVNGAVTNGMSDAFKPNPAPVVPEPATVVLLAMMSGTLLFSGRRRAKAAVAAARCRL